MCVTDLFSAPLQLRNLLRPELGGVLRLREITGCLRRSERIVLTKRGTAVLFLPYFAFDFKTHPSCTLLAF